MVLQRKKSCALLEQLRCVDRASTGMNMGKIDKEVWRAVLLEMLA